MIKMTQNMLEIFFTGKFFVVPKYQRDYAWDLQNIEDLFEDILESIRTTTGHYIGTFILSKKDNQNFYIVVDGQQRLTTLIMILNLIIANLSSEPDKIINKDKFLFSDGKWKLDLGDQIKNDFFRKLLESGSPNPINKSQKLLKDAYDYIENRIRSLKSDDPNKIKTILDCVKKLEVMEFIESNEGKAIRIFLTVNDRGKLLSNAEKAKSLLIYYSNRFLDGELDNEINNKFGEIFQCYNDIREIGEENNITLISQRNFTEDSIMRYHFISFKNDKYDYNATGNYVWDTFLKGTLREIKPVSEKDKLKSFIENYVNDLNLFFKSFLLLLQKINQKKYYKIFSILELSTFLYPLTIRLQAMNLLDRPLPNNPKLTFIDLIVKYGCTYLQNKRNRSSKRHFIFGPRRN